MSKAGVQSEPPQGVIGYVVIPLAPGVQPALFLDQEKAISYAARYGGEWWPLVCAKRASDLPQGVRWTPP